MTIAEASRRPLLFTHTLGGNPSCYYDLARELRVAQTVYGLQARWILGRERPDHTIGAIPAHCIQSMRTVQPDGPYLLAGFSGGGVVAFEVAQRHAAAGKGWRCLPCSIPMLRGPACSSWGSTSWLQSRAIAP